jgi:hypothetical protein
MLDDDICRAASIEHRGSRTGILIPSSNLLDSADYAADTSGNDLPLGARQALALFNGAPLRDPGP